MLSPVDGERRCRGRRRRGEAETVTNRPRRLLRPEPLLCRAAFAQVLGIWGALPTVMASLLRDDAAVELAKASEALAFELA